MSVHKTKDGRWFVAYYPEGQDRTRAKRKYFGRGAQAKQAAEDWDYAFKKAKRSGDTVQAREIEAEADELTFLEVAERYLSQHPLREKSRYSIAAAINKHVADLWGQTPINALTMRHLADLDARLVKRGLSVSTRNRVRSYCRAICQWGVDNGMAKANPFSRFKADRKREGKAPDLVTEQELRAIWAAASDHLRWAITCILNLGVRPGKTELFAIKMSDVDFERSGIWVTRTKTYSRRELVPVQPLFLEAIRALIEKEPGRVYLVEYERHPGQPIGSLKRAWWATLRRAGITRRIRPYDLRHFFASNLLQAGADVKAVSELLGHSSPNMTLSVYYHLLERQKSDAMALLKLPDLASNSDT